MSEILGQVTILQLTEYLFVVAVLCGAFLLINGWLLLRSKAPAELVESLERSKRQVEAGMTVSGETALARVRDSIARIKVKG